jgi:cytochrome d ubiquinol oxidase subunit II
MAVTATAAGTIRIENGLPVSGYWAWVTPFTLVGGLVGTAICAYLAPIYMTVRTRAELREDFRRRGMAAGLVLGALTAVEIPVARLSAPLFFERLLAPRALSLVALAATCGLATLLLLRTRRFLAAQFASAVTVALTLGGFAAALYPDLIIGEITISAAAAPRPTLVVFFIVLPFGALILVPSLIFLYWTFRGRPDPHAPPKRRPG